MFPGYPTEEERRAEKRADILSEARADTALGWIADNVVDARTRETIRLEPWQEAIVRDVVEGRPLPTPAEREYHARRGQKRARLAVILALAALDAERAEASA